ncbi:MAG: ArsR/SmtB family transcription factor [Steroidobacteraceae bacterium]
MIDVASRAAIRALASDKRLLILQWLKAPEEHFPPQTYGDLIEDGVCGLFIAQKLRVTQPTASEHLKVLTQAGLLRAKRIRQWTFYRRDERRIRELRRALSRM